MCCVAVWLFKAGHIAQITIFNFVHLGKVNHAIKMWIKKNGWWYPCFCKWTTDFEEYKQGVLGFSGYNSVMFSLNRFDLIFRNSCRLFQQVKMLQVKVWHAKIPAMETKHPGSEKESKGCGLLNNWLKMDMKWPIIKSTVYPLCRINCLNMQLDILSLSLGIKTNKSSNDQVFQEVCQVLQLYWVSHFLISNNVICILEFIVSRLKWLKKQN